MNFIELLILLAFIFFPLIQVLLEKMGGGKKGEAPPEVEGDPTPSPAGTLQRRRGEPSRVEDGWSTGWGQWPAETLEELAAEEVVTEEGADELIAYQQRLEAREASEAARATVPVVSMEALEVDRVAEHQRFHDRLRKAPPPVVRQRVGVLEGALRQSSDLRRAMVLAEVLGPPRALQSAEESNRH